jgi:hypothetical protein
MDWKWIFAIIGAVVGYYGYREYKLSAGASATPEPISIEELAKGVPANPYRKIGECAPVEYSVVYMEKNGKIEYAYYPIISRTDPYWGKVTTLLLKHGGDTSKIKPSDAPVLESFSVLIKTNRYATKSALMAAEFPDKDISGMVVNAIESLGSQEEKLLRQAYPKFDAKNTIIFQENRKPTSSSTAMLMLGGGAFLIVLAPALWFIGRQRAAAAEAEMLQGSPRNQWADVAGGSAAPPAGPSVPGPGPQDPWQKPPG